MAGDTTPDAFVPSAYFERIHGLPRSRSQPQKNLDIGVYDADFFIYRKFREFEADLSALLSCLAWSNAIFVFKLPIEIRSIFKTGFLCDLQDRQIC